MALIVFISLFGIAAIIGIIWQHYYFKDKVV